MLSVTLDTNCLIALEDGSGQADAIRRLIALHDQGVVRVYVGTISASENVREGREPSYVSFAERIDLLGLAHLPHLLPEMRIGMSYIGRAVVAGDDSLDLKVQEIVRPKFSGGYEAFMSHHRMNAEDPLHPKWRNMFCDVDGMVAHIRNGNDVFVTHDRHFLDRKAALIALGAGDVLNPDETLEWVTSHGA